MVTTLREGAVIGGHRVRSALFHTAAFSAYSATDSRGRSVCLLCSDERANRPSDDAFATGLTALRELRDEGLPQVFAGGRDDTFSWITTEPLGATEPCWAPGAEPLHWLRVLKVAKKTSQVLAIASEAGLRHGILGPACIRRFKNGRLCVVGVGVAVLFGVDRGEVLKSPRYAAPEQLEGVPYALDDATDIYALGIWMHAALAGREPFESATQEELLAVVKHGSLSIDVDELVPSDVWETLVLVTRKRREDRIGEWNGATALLINVTDYCLKQAFEEGRDAKLEGVLTELLLEEAERMAPGDFEAFLHHAEAGGRKLGGADDEPSADSEGDAGAEPDALDALPVAGSDAAASPHPIVLPSVILVQGATANDAQRPPARRPWTGAYLFGGAMFLAASCAFVAWLIRPRSTAHLSPLPALVVFVASADLRPWELERPELDPTPRARAPVRQPRGRARTESARGIQGTRTWAEYFDGFEPVPLRQSR